MRNILGKKLYSVKETSELLGVSKTSINNYTKRGLRATTLGGRRFFAEEDIKAFLKPVSR